MLRPLVAAVGSEALKSDLGRDGEAAAEVGPVLSKELSTGTTIKDTWTKPRGRVEVGKGGGFTWGGVKGWGEKAYNCN